MRLPVPAPPPDFHAFRLAVCSSSRSAARYPRDDVPSPHYAGVHGVEQRLGCGAGGSAHPRRQTLPWGQSSWFSHGLSMSHAELRSTHAATNSDPTLTAAPQVHRPMPSASIGHWLLKGSQVQAPWRHEPLPHSHEPSRSQSSHPARHVHTSSWVQRRLPRLQHRRPRAHDSPRSRQRPSAAASPPSPSRARTKAIEPLARTRVTLRRLDAVANALVTRSNREPSIAISSSTPGRPDRLAPLGSCLSRPAASQGMTPPPVSRVGRRQHHAQRLRSFVADR